MQQADTIWGNTLLFGVGLGAAECHGLSPTARMPLPPGIKLFWAGETVLPSKCLEHLHLQSCPGQGYNSQKLSLPYQNSHSPLFLIRAGALMPQESLCL